MIVQIKKKLLVILFLVSTFIIIQVVNVAMDGDLTQYGIIPRNPRLFFQLFTAPFIHFDWNHLFSNLAVFCTLGTICILRSIRYFMVASLFIILVSGGLVWSLGRSAVHIGASGWVFGLWGLSIASGWFERSIKSISIALLVVFLYGGLVFGVLPIDHAISFESHLFGALAGIIFSYMHAKWSLGRGVKS